MIIEGDCLEVMKTFPDNHFSGIVTDPPYGLSFMGKGWDHDVPGHHFWEAAKRIVKPGAFLLAMGGTRKFHRLCGAIENAGFEIRDTIMWLYGSGFPKSHNNFGLEGYGTALKPAYEPILLAMKPLDGTFKQNAEKWGLGGLNIDGCRVGPSSMDGREMWRRLIESTQGRWPANLILDEEAGAVLDEQSGASKSTPFGNPTCGFHDALGRSKKKREEIGKGFSDSGGASRFFYCAKASSRERNEGLDDFPEQSNMRVNGPRESEDDKTKTKVRTNHPTVKPLALMRYLITLISPPTNALILDPFAGSGTTVLAAHQLGIKCIGIEKQPEYVKIARARIERREGDKADEADEAVR